MKIRLLFLLLIFGFYTVTVHSQVGFTCNNPILITQLPYSTADNTGNYGDTTDIPQPPACAGTSSNYMTGNDVFYSFTPTSSGNINIAMTPTGTWSGIFVYNGCSNVGVACMAGVANSGSTVRNIPNLPVVAGQQYIIVISTNAAPQTVGYTLVVQNVSCAQPTTLSGSGITQTSANLSWAAGSAASWEVAVQTSGTPIPSGAGQQTINITNYTVNQLSPGTQYQFWVRADCGNGTFSAWAGPYMFTTLPPTPVCGGTFMDTGGATGNYSNNEDITTTICPTPGKILTVTFTSFNTQANTDGLYVFDGNSIQSPQIASTNGPGVVPGGLAGAYWGNTIPGPFTASGPNGCLTFRFRSNATITASGWTADVQCTAGPSCPKPYLITTPAILSTSVHLAWTEAGTASEWQILAVPCAAPAPTVSSTGWVTATSNPYVLTGLTALTCYDVYIRSNCSGTELSEWTGPISITTQAVPPACGEYFYDSGGANANYGSNENTTTTICPNNPGEVVTVVFNSFFTENNVDFLRIYNGISTSSPLVGTYSGNTIPQTFTSTAPDGCLTFKFTSNANVNYPGWDASVFCTPPPTCMIPTALEGSAITQTTATLSWTENSNATFWEIIVLPEGASTPAPTATGQIVTSNPAVVSGLNPGTVYNFYVRSVCSSNEMSFWSARKQIITQPINDECSTATVVQVGNANCSLSVPGATTGATGSVGTNLTCGGSADDDVWFKFTATHSTISISIQNIVGTTADLKFAIYSGECGALTQISCNPANGLLKTLDNLIVGNTYYIRIYTVGNLTEIVNFNLCVMRAATCAESLSVCNAINYPNTINILSTVSVGCLVTTPNPSFFTVKIANSGIVKLLMYQKTVSGFSLDVDYAAWGPFQNQNEACTAVSNGQAPGIGVPLTQQTGCSYSVASAEMLNINNALAGEYYIILITNFSNQPGIINIIQTNNGAAGAGAIDCSGFRMNAFIDANSNGIQDVNEVNFPLGQFQYDMNNSGNVHNIYSPSGNYTVYDNYITNSYNLSHTVNSDFSSMYSSSVSYNNVTVTTGNMSTYNFPVISLQNYNDLGVSIVPLNAPRAGASYKNKIVFSNNGNQTIAAGTLTFNKNNGTAITNISQAGTTPISNGFTYNFSNLLPFESRSIVVTMSVPPIPDVSIGQLLTNSAFIDPPAGDLIAANNASSSVQQIIAAYDPNDKMESHGEKIPFSSFSPNEYLNYTIRFENTGNASALKVSVTDVLDSRLDENSLVMLDASHNYSLDRTGNLLVWNFEDIQLPVSVPDTEIGKGYINFKIRLKPGFAIGDIIPNTAKIYFDTNPAIITNTFKTEFVSQLGMPSFNVNNIIMYPNPAKNSVLISIQNSNENLNSIGIYDLIGKTFKKINNLTTNQMSVDLSDLAKGVYVVEIILENENRYTKKLIIK